MVGSRTNQEQVRRLSLGLSVALVGLLTVLVRHELVECKPHKLFFPFVEGPLASAGAWLPLLVFALGSLVALAATRIHAAPAPLVAVAVGVAAAFAAFTGAIDSWSSGAFVEGDFGSAAVRSAFRGFIVAHGSRLLAVAAVASIGIALVRRRYEH